MRVCAQRKVPAKCYKIGCEAMREVLYKSSTYEFIRIGQHVSSLNILFENLDLLIMLPDIKVALESIFFL